ncbi:hypothetical protein X975_07838, partial [Stegodyphus mimosarum]
MEAEVERVLVVLLLALLLEQNVELEDKETAMLLLPLLLLRLPLE